MPLNLQDLNDIQAICTAGSFRKAAERLGITQPTLSSRVAQMEKRAGALLFERARGRSQPTTLALMISDRSSDLLADAGNLVSEVRRIAQSEGGTVRVSMGPAPAAAFLDKLIARTNERFPNISLVCRSGSVETLMRRLDSGDTDLVVCARDPELDRPRFASSRLIKDKIVIATSPHHPLAKRPPVRIGEVFKYPVTMPILEPFYRKKALETFDIDLAKLQGVAYCSNFHVMERLATHNGYVILGPEMAFQEPENKGILKTSAFPGHLPHEVFIFTNRKALPFPTVDAVIDLLKQIVRTLPEKSAQ